MSRSLPRVEACWLGSVPYREAWELQRELVRAVGAGTAPDTLLLLEHPHVFTLGRRGVEEHVLWDAVERERRQVELVWSDRGGDATYHGPGQLVGYPILDLRRHGGDILAYIRKLEQSLVTYLASLDIQSRTIPGLTGVWCGDEKVAAIGIRLTDGVVSHGFALNLTTRLEYFGGIVPCGLDKCATSVAALTDRVIETRTGARDYADFFATAFEVRIRWREMEPRNVITGSDPIPAVSARELPVLS